MMSADGTKPVAATAEERADYIDNHLKPLIAEHRWAVQGCVPGSPEEPAWFYTIGLTGMGLPELVVVGLPEQYAIPVLNEVAGRHIADPLPPGGEIDMDGLKMRIVGVDQDEVAGRLIFAESVYGAGNVTAVQVLWSDKDGFWPDQPSWPHGRAQYRISPDGSYRRFVAIVKAAGASGIQPNAVRAQLASEGLKVSVRRFYDWVDRAHADGSLVQVLGRGDYLYAEHPSG